MVIMQLYVFQIKLLNTGLTGHNKCKSCKYSKHRHQVVGFVIKDVA